MQERCEEPRGDSHFTANVILAGLDHYGWVKNISPSGFLFICENKFSEGSKVQIDLSIPEGSVFRLTGHIAWVAPEEEDSGAGHSYGIQLEEPRKSFKRYVEKMLPELHPDEAKKPH